MEVTLAQMRVIEAVARTGAIGRAARELGVSQPSVSAALNGFEARFRVRLFARDGRSLRPTALCEALLPRLRTVVALADEIERQMLSETALASGRLSVGYSTDQFVMPVLSRFMAEHPGVRIEARSMASGDLLRLLKDGAIEAAFVTLDAPEEGLEARLLRRERIVLMMPAGHPLAGAGPLPWRAVAGLPLIRREGTSGTRRIFDRAARANGVSPSVVIDLGSWASLRAAVVAGIGVAVAMAGEIGEHPEIAAVPIDDEALVVGHWLVTQPSLALLATVSALFDACPPEPA